MKRRRVFVWFVLVTLIALMMAPGSALARASRVEITGSEVPVDLISEGVWAFFPNGNVHVRGMTTVYQELSSDPRMAGLNTVVMNANWKPDFAGPMWGTSESVLPESGDCPGGGLWKGSWTGLMNVDGSYSYRAVGRGVSGCVKGLHFSLLAENSGGNALTTYQGEILDPHGE